MPDGSRYASLVSSFQSLPFSMKDSVLVGAFVRVRAEIVALCLRKVGRQSLRAIGVVIVERRRERETRNAQAHSRLDDQAQGFLATHDVRSKAFVEQEVFQVRIPP